jgi:hypothetical protein
MKTLGPLYAGRLEYYHNRMFPVIEIGSTQETEMPFRKGKCLVFRVPFTKPGWYAGIFYHNPKIEVWDDEGIDEILYGAMKGREAWRPQDGAYEEFFHD